jgi:hypothetical protein
MKMSDHDDDAMTLTFKRQKYQGQCSLCGHGGAFWVLAGVELPLTPASHRDEGMMFAEFSDSCMGLKATIGSMAP